MHHRVSAIQHSGTYHNVHTATSVKKLTSTQIQLSLTPTCISTSLTVAPVQPMLQYAKDVDIPFTGIINTDHLATPIPGTSNKIIKVMVRTDADTIEDMIGKPTLIPLMSVGTMTPMWIRSIWLWWSLMPNCQSAHTTLK